MNNYEKMTPTKRDLSSDPKRYPELKRLKEDIKKNEEILTQINQTEDLDKIEKLKKQAKELIDENVGQPLPGEQASVFFDEKKQAYFSRGAKKHIGSHLMEEATEPQEIAEKRQKEIQIEIDKQETEINNFIQEIKKKMSQLVLDLTTPERIKKMEEYRQEINKSTKVLGVFSSADKEQKRERALGQMEAAKEKIIAGFKEISEEVKAFVLSKIGDKKYVPENGYCSLSHLYRQLHEMNLDLTRTEALMSIKNREKIIHETYTKKLGEEIYRLEQAVRELAKEYEFDPNDKEYKTKIGQSFRDVKEKLGFKVKVED